MKYSSRFFLYAPIGAFLVVAAGVSLLWWHSAGAFEQKLADLKGREAVPGVTLDWSMVAIGGFPFRVDAVFTDFSARGAGPHGPFRWDSPHVALHKLTYNANRVIFEAAGEQRLSWVDAAERPRNVRFTPGSLHASALMDKDGLSRFDLDIARFNQPGFAIARLQFHLRRGENDSIDMVAAADGGKGEMGAFGQQFRQLRLYNTLQRATAYHSVLRGGIAPAGAHAAWHERGGTANVTRTELNGQESGMTPEQGGTIVSLMEALY
jgi:hypothetical protein